jgi:hypothetical protein
LTELAGFSKTKKQIEQLPPQKKERAVRLLSKIVFMDAELEKLQKILQEKGWAEKYQNGANQYGLKKSTEGDIYNTLIKNYITAMKNLNDMLPEDSEELDDLDKFMQS